MLLRTYTKNHVTDLSSLGFHENCANYGAEIKKTLQFLTDFHVRLTK